MIASVIQWICPGGSENKDRGIFTEQRFKAFKLEEIQNPVWSLIFGFGGLKNRQCSRPIHFGDF